MFKKTFYFFHCEFCISLSPRLFMVLGVMGNLATCLVILNNEYMRTPTNVYLLNLAIADIATLVISKLSATSCEHTVLIEKNWRINYCSSQSIFIDGVE